MFLMYTQEVLLVGVHVHVINWVPGNIFPPNSNNKSDKPPRPSNFLKGSPGSHSQLVSCTSQVAARFYYFHGNNICDVIIAHMIRGDAQINRCGKHKANLGPTVRMLVCGQLVKV